MVKWRTVLANGDNYNNYEVSNTGLVRNQKRGKILNPRSVGRAYFEIGLYKDGKQKFYLVHRLVLEAFVRPCPTGNQANHKDGCKFNNNLHNLEWVTPYENTKHAYDTGLRYNRRHSAETKAKMAKSGYGKKHTEESKAKMRKAKEGLYVGEKHPRAKLSEKDVIEIRQLADKGVKQSEIVELKSISLSVVNKIINRKAWRHVE